MVRLDLEAWINDPPSSSSDESEEERFEDEKVPNIFIKGDRVKETRKYEEPSEEVLERVSETQRSVASLIAISSSWLFPFRLQLREARRLEVENNPNYLKPDSNSKKNNETSTLVNNIETQSPATIPGE